MRADFFKCYTSYAGESSTHYAHSKKLPARMQPMFGGEGFFKPNEQPHFNLLQRVPETPALQPAMRQRRAYTPQTEDCRLNFSCELVEYRK